MSIFEKIMGKKETTDSAAVNREVNEMEMKDSQVELPSKSEAAMKFFENLPNWKSKIDAGDEATLEYIKKWAENPVKPNAQYNEDTGKFEAFKGEAFNG